MSLPEGATGRQERLATFERATLNSESRTVDLAFSSEAPVERWWGMEILGHSVGEVEDEFIGGGTAPLLMDHNPRDQIGVVERVTLGADRKMRASVRFSRSARGEEVMQDVADGIRSNVSVGYEILALDLVKEEKGKPSVYRATRWRPLEVSLVSIPADSSVGVGRDAPNPITPEPTPTPARVPAQPRSQEGRMADTNTPATPEADAALEQKRQAGIMALAELANARDKGVDAVLAGKSLEAFRGELLLARQGQQRPLGPVAAEIGMTPKETARYSLFNAMRAAAENDWSNAGLELEAHREVAKRLGERKAVGKRSFYVPFEVQARSGMPGQRDLTAGTASAGGYLVATSNQSFIEILRGRSVTMAMGATRLSGLVGNVTVPKQTGAATAYWLANEATAITEGNQTFGQMALTPKNVGGYTEVSRQLMMQSDPSAEMIVMNDLAAIVALGVDTAALNGSGSAGEPTGILNTGSIGSVSGTSLAYAGVLEFQSDVAAANALVNPGNAGYVTTPAVAALLMARQRFSSTDTPLWDGNIMDGRMAGFRAMSSTQVPTASAIFGDWSQLVIGEWGTLEVDVNPFANFAAGITGVRAFYTVDVGVRYAASFSAASSIT
jgi:HK97 family phage major capsid protein